MRLLFTKNNMPLSWLIRWGLDEPVSHVSFVFDEKLVFHSQLFGVHLAWFDTFKKSQTIVYELDISGSLEYEESVYLSLLGQVDGRPYDYKAFCYFMWRGLLKKVFGIPMPKTSIHNDKRAFLCTELAFVILKLLKLDEKEIDLSVTSPFQLFQIARRIINDPSK